MAEMEPRSTYGVTVSIVTLVVTIVAFASNKFRLDIVAVASAIALHLLGILSKEEALAGFSDSVVLLIASSFIVGQAVFQTGLAARLGGWISRKAGADRVRLTLLMMAVTSMLSSFISSTGTVAVMLPVVSTVAEHSQGTVTKSMLLMPLSFASMVGGMLTLVGTPPNIVASKVMEDGGYEPFGFFDYSAVSAICLIITLGYLLVAPPKLLKPVPTGRRSSLVVPEEEVNKNERKPVLAAEFDLLKSLSKVRVPLGSWLVSKRLDQIKLRTEYGVSVLAIESVSEAPRSWFLRHASHDSMLQAQDLLYVHISSQERAGKLFSERALEVVSDGTTARFIHLAEIIVSPTCPLVGSTPTECSFRSRFRLQMLAMFRGTKRINLQDVPSTKFEVGDTLIVAGESKAIKAATSGPDGQFTLVSTDSGKVFDPAAVLDKHGLAVAEKAGELRKHMAPPTEQQSKAKERKETKQSRDANVTMAIVLAALVFLTLGLISSTITLMIAAGMLLSARVLTMEQAYLSMNWESLVLIAGILPIATALDKSGAVELIVQSLLGVMTGVGPWGILAVMALLTSLLSQVISNTATTVVVAPVVFRLAVELGVSPRPFVMAVALAASTAFSTPVATPVNLLVYVPGGYAFFDFLKLGGPLQVLLLGVIIAFVPLVFPF